MKLIRDEKTYPPREDSYLLSRVVKQISKGKTVLDIGTGTGIQAITAALNGARDVVATDINPDALKLAKENAKLNKVKIEVIESDLFAKVKGKFDLIIFNAPYLPSGPVPPETSPALAELPQRGHDDPQWSGGKELIEKFLKEAKNHLTEGGKIVYVFSSLTGLEDASIIALEKMEDGEVIYIAEE